MRSLLLVTLVAIATLSPRAASAAEPPSEAGRLAQEGLREFQLGHWAEAMALFEDSLRERPSGRVQRGIAKCLFEMRMYVRALAACDRALAERQDALPEELADDVLSLRARAARFTSEVILHVTPEAATVAIDGRTASRAQRLDLGSHSIRVEATGYEAQVASFEVVASGAPMSLRFDLRASGTRSEAERPALWPPLVGGIAAAVAATVGAGYVADRGAAIGDCEALSARGSGCANVDALERERVVGIAVTALGVGAFALCGYFLVRVLTTPAPAPARNGAYRSEAFTFRF